ncbi:signal peptidase II [Paracoccus ravus]|uniref:signal peptidase II n=1 Tax=Paracoccus ravus TaxID=2447760 RepID=UPI001FD70FEC|nr:signal peptidase II [Paracoccus ravus]
MSITAAAIFLADQLLKYVVVHLLHLDQLREIDVIDPWLNLRMAWNQGMNFGLFSSEIDVMRWVLIGIALAVCLWVAIWLGRAKTGRLARISAGLLIGGALGNVVDRLVYGAVADFLNMSLPGWRNPYSFNLADIAIFIGALGLVFQPPEAAEKKTARRQPPKARAPKAPAPRAKTEPDAATEAGQGKLGLDEPGQKPRDGAGNSR